MMSNKVLYFEGIDDILINFMTTPDTPTSAPVYDKEIYRLPIATKLGVKGNGSVLEKWASSKLFRRVGRQTKHELSLDHVGMPIEILDKMNDLIATKGVVFNTSKAKELPYFAFGFVGRIEGGERMAVWYPKVQLSNTVDSEYTTAEEETEIKDVSAAFVAVGLLYNDVINSAFDSTRESANLITLEKFITTPIFEEAQLEEVPPTGKLKEDKKNG
ncbi:major tail protein [Carnobacterium divergens]|uniref:major tail protein n=1 Tax=Carnobacterium divergens TaxID=2748 RepID=UPI0039BDD78A